MQASSRKQSVVWGGLLILFGIFSLIEFYTDLSTQAWAGMLALAGLFALIVYLTDRSNRALLLPVYILWAIAATIVVADFNLLPQQVMGLFVMTLIAIPFLGVYLVDNANWWALIPAFALMVIGVLIVLVELNLAPGAFLGPVLFGAIALPFLIVYFRNRENWWALIPAYVLLALALMILLDEAGVLNDLLIPAYVMFAVAIPFFAVYANNRENWWALIPAGIVSLIGLGLLFAEAALELIVPFLMIIGGIWILLRQFRKRDSLNIDET